MVYHVNETNSGPNATGPLQWVTQTYYIQGYADDPRFLELDNFTVNNTTHYDFYWYAIWEDADGETQYIEQTWFSKVRCTKTNDYERKCEWKKYPLHPKGIQP